jgi:hypothetical protein
VRVRPKEFHRYDNVDLDYDVKVEQKEHIRNPDYQPKSKSCIHMSFFSIFAFFLFCHVFLFSCVITFNRLAKTDFSKKAVG